MRQYAQGQHIAYEVANQEVVLHYALALLAESGLVPRRLQADVERICTNVRERFAFLAKLDADEQTLLADQAAHRERRLFDQLRIQARERASTVPR